MPYRVLHILSNLGTYGAQRLVGDLLPELNREPFDVSAMTLYDSIVDPGVPVVQIGRDGRTDVSFFWRMVSRIRAIRPIIAHTHTHNGKYWGRAAALAAGVQIIVHTEHCPTDASRIWIERIGDTLLNKATRATVVFQPSHTQALRSVEKIAEDRLVVIPNGIAPIAEPSPEARGDARRALGVGEATFTIFMVGRLARAKHIDVAVRAIAALAPEIRDRVALRIIGDGPERGAFEDLVKGLNLERWVEFLGFRADARALWAGADLLLVASDHEGMPMSVLEAMSAGVPVLTSPWDGASELVGNGTRGWITPSWNPVHFADALTGFVNGSIATAKQIENARAFAMQSHGIDQTAALYRNLYERLLNVTQKCA